MKEENKKQTLELSTILELGIESYRKSHSLCSVQEKAIKDILSCRTSSKGGHVKKCNSCGFTHQAYNSCRNRHCPKCQYVKQEKWVDKLSNNLLPCKYYHIVFTVPKELHSIFYLNQKECYNILFNASSKALLKSALNPDFLGAQTGALSVLHTWTQTLCYHPHIHMLVPAGGLSEDGVEWVNKKGRFFMPQKVLSRIFRGIMLSLLQELIINNRLKYPESIPDFKKVKKALYNKDWNVYIKKSFRGANSVLKYLGRYTHRVAISNHRLKSCKEQKVCFYYKDNKDKGKTKLMTLDINEFIRRFLQHILPNNFYKIRYTGILAIINSKTKKNQSISLIGQELSFPKLEGISAIDVMGMIKKGHPLKCPKCQSGILLLNTTGFK